MEEKKETRKKVFLTGLRKKLSGLHQVVTGLGTLILSSPSPMWRKELERGQRKVQDKAPCSSACPHPQHPLPLSPSMPDVPDVPACGDLLSFQLEINSLGALGWEPQVPMQIS